MRDDIIDAVKHGDMPIDDVRLMNRLIRDVNSGSKLDEAVAAVEATASSPCLSLRDRDEPGRRPVAHSGRRTRWP